VRLTGEGGAEQVSRCESEQVGRVTGSWERF
jgi:hypothetical protein